MKRHRKQLSNSKRMFNTGPHLQILNACKKRQVCPACFLRCNSCCHAMYTYVPPQQKFLDRTCAKDNVRQMRVFWWTLGQAQLGTSESWSLRRLRFLHKSIQILYHGGPCHLPPTQDVDVQVVHRTGNKRQYNHQEAKTQCKTLRNAKNIQEKGWLKVLSWHLGFCSGHMDHQANFIQLICTCGPTESDSRWISLHRPVCHIQGWEMQIAGEFYKLLLLHAIWWIPPMIPQNVAKCGNWSYESIKSEAATDFWSTTFGFLDLIMTCLCMFVLSV